MATPPIPPLLGQGFRLQPDETDGWMATIDGGSAIGIGRRHPQELRCYADRPISQPSSIWADHGRPRGVMVVRPRIARVSRVRACLFLALVLLTAEASAQQPSKGRPE